MALISPQNSNNDNPELCILGNFLCFYCHLLTSFNFFSVTLSECQRVCNQIITDIFSVLTWVQYDCKGYQQKTKFKVYFFQKNTFRNTIGVSSFFFDPDQGKPSVGPDLGLSCLQRIISR